MLKINNIKSYEIVVGLAIILILPVNAIAQSNVIPQANAVPQVNAVPQRNAVPQASAVPQRNAVPQASAVPQRNAVPQASAVPQRNAVPQASAVPQNNTVPPKKKLSITAVLATKVAKLEGQLSSTKTAFITALNSGVEKDKKISILTATGVEKDKKISILTATGVEKDTKLASLYEDIKGLQGLASERDKKFASLKDAHKKYKDVISCYKKALSTWDNHLREDGLLEQHRISISTVLHASLRECPPTEVDPKSGMD